LASWQPLLAIKLSTVKRLSMEIAFAGYHRNCPVPSKKKNNSLLVEDNLR